MVSQQADAELFQRSLLSTKLKNEGKLAVPIEETAAPAKFKSKTNMEAFQRNLLAERFGREASERATTKATEETRQDEIHAAAEKAAEQAKQQEIDRLAAEKLAEEAAAKEEAKILEEKEKARLAAEEKDAAERARLVAAEEEAERARLVVAEEEAEKARLVAAEEEAERARLVAAEEAAEKARLVAEAEAAEKARLAAEEKVAAEKARLVAEAEAAEKARLAAEEKVAAEKARLVAEAEAAEKARVAAEEKVAAEKARLVAEAEAAENARIAAEKAKLIAAEEAVKKAAEEKRAEIVALAAAKIAALVAAAEEEVEALKSRSAEVKARAKLIADRVPILTGSRFLPSADDYSSALAKVKELNPKAIELRKETNTELVREVAGGLATAVVDGFGTGLDFFDAVREDDELKSVVTDALKTAQAAVDVLVQRNELDEDDVSAALQRKALILFIAVDSIGVAAYASICGVLGYSSEGPVQESASRAAEGLFEAISAAAALSFRSADTVAEGFQKAKEEAQGIADTVAESTQKATEKSQGIVEEKKAADEWIAAEVVAAPEQIKALELEDEGAVDAAYDSQELFQRSLLAARVKSMKSSS
jgi:hypothetical protein